MIWLMKMFSSTSLFALLTDQIIRASRSKGSSAKKSDVKYDSDSGEMFSGVEDDSGDEYKKPKRSVVGL